MQAAFKNNLAVESLPVLLFLVGCSGDLKLKGRIESALTAMSKVFADNLSSLHQGAHLGQPTRKWWDVPCRAFHEGTALSYVCTIHADKKLVVFQGGECQSSFNWLQQEEKIKQKIKKKQFP